MADWHPFKTNGVAWEVNPIQVGGDTHVGDHRPMSMDWLQGSPNPNIQRGPASRNIRTVTIEWVSAAFLQQIRSWYFLDSLVLTDDTGEDFLAVMDPSTFPHSPQRMDGPEAHYRVTISFAIYG